MAQHDFVISNQSFPATRADINAFLQAVGSTHSGTSLPSGAVAGLIWLDTTNATIPLLKYYDGADNITLATINHSTNSVVFTGVGATELSSDTTPQLGGDLDVQTNKVVTTANRNVLVYPNGTGVLEVGGSTNSGRIQLNCEQNTHGIKLASPPHSAGANYTLVFPNADGTNGQVLQTNGSGVLSFATPSSGTNTPAWSVTTNGSAHAVSVNVRTIVQFSVENFDLGSVFNTSTYKATPTSGKYLLTANVTLKVTGNTVQQMWIQIMKNSTTIAKQGYLLSTGVFENATGQSFDCSVTATANGTDTFHVEVYYYNGTAEVMAIDGNAPQNFSGIKIIE